MDLREIARRYYAAGLNVLPALKAQKRPVGSWKKYVEERPPFDVAFPPGVQFDALCVAGGKTSGGLEILDFDQKGRAFDDWTRRLPPALSDLLNTLPAEITQSGGRHIGYRCETVEGNKKLANDENGKVLIETRGAGGICLIAPSPGYSVIWGDWATVPTITPEQRAQLWAAARACDLTPKRITPAPIMNPPNFTGESVADRLRSDLETVRKALTRAGWEFLGTSGDFEQWQRPNQPQAGKLGGSLCINPQSNGYACFHCFTSNAAPLTVEGNYSPLDLIAALEYGGDRSQAAKAYAPKQSRDFLSELPAETNPFTVEAFRAAVIAAAEKRRESVDEWELITDESETRFFDILNQLPAPIAESVEECARGFNIFPVAVLSLELTILGGWIGRNRARMRVAGRDADPLIHSCCVGDSGSGKSPLMDMLIRPILDIQTDEKARSNLMKERRETHKNGGDLEEIEKEIDAIRAKIDALKISAQNYLMKAASPQGVIRMLDRNAKGAKAQKRNPPGAIIYGTEGQRIYNNRLGASQTADEWGIWNDIADGGINNAETKDDSTTDKEYSYSAAFCTGIQGASCNWIKSIELKGNGFANRTNWVYLDYRYGVNPNFADAEKLDKRRRIFEASYEWQGATFYPSDELTSAFNAWRIANKLRADKYHRRGDKAGAAYLLKNEKQVLRIALVLHIVRKFWELVADDTRDFPQWRRLGRRERLRGAAPELLKELETARSRLLDILGRSDALRRSQGEKPPFNRSRLGV